MSEPSLAPPSLAPIQALIAAARQLAEVGYVPGRHQMFSALRTISGKIFLGSHIEGGNGRVTVCAEAIAIGAAATAQDTQIQMIVAVTESGQIVPPCGICRDAHQRLLPPSLSHPAGTARHPYGTHPPTPATQISKFRLPE